MEATRNRDGLYIAYQEIESQRRGISPKLSLYATLTKQMQELSEQLGGQEFLAPTKGVTRMTSLNGVRINVVVNSNGLTKNFAKANQKCSHRTETTKCLIATCGLVTPAKGLCKSCGKSKFRSFCRGHRLKDL